MTPQQYRWLMEGLKVEQLKAHRPEDGLRIIIAVEKLKTLEILDFPVQI